MRKTRKRVASIDGRELVEPLTRSPDPRNEFYIELHGAAPSKTEVCGGHAFAGKRHLEAALTKEFCLDGSFHSIWLARTSW